MEIKKEYIVELREEEADELMDEHWVGELVRCKDCKHRPTAPENKEVGPYLVFPDEICPCQIDDDWYSWMPKDDWFCAGGERR